MVLLWIICSSLIVSCISLIGVITLAVKKETLQKGLLLMVGFATGGLLGGAFFHILPESIAGNDPNQIFLFTLAGFTAFFALERFFYWHHCHDNVCDEHAFVYLNIIGDTIHNFVDGLVIAASFIVDIKLGIVTSLAIVFHEIPQELGDFGVMIYGGFSVKKALLYNFLSALAALAGAIGGYFIAETIPVFSKFLLPFTAGGFIYIACSDLIPEIQHKRENLSRANLSFLFFLIGLAFMYFSKMLLHVE